VPLKPIKDRKDQNIAELRNKTITKNVKIVNCTNCTVENCTVKSEEKGHMFVLQNCMGCTVKDSKFLDKMSEGCAVKVDGDANNEKTIPKGNRFENCEWKNLRGKCEEPLRIGDSRRGHLFYDTVVSNCKFIDLEADEETISIKSGGNTIENCIHRNCKSSITIRHGSKNTIKDCKFTGEGGIRVLGKDNTIKGNKFKDNKAEKHIPLRVHLGNKDKEQNEGKSKSAKEHSFYTQVKNVTISGNIFDNCKTCVLWAVKPKKKGSYKFKPDDVEFTNNEFNAGSEQSEAIKFVDGEPCDKEAKPPYCNKFANNRVQGNVKVDRRIEDGFT
jgi:hypothetical protein